MLGQSNKWLVGPMVLVNMVTKVSEEKRKKHALPTRMGKQFFKEIQLFRLVFVGLECHGNTLAEIPGR